ncbi:MAG: WYL domain-containing protein [Actinomycetota bacterium]
MHKVIERILNLLAFLLTVGRPVTADEIRNTVKGYEQPTDAAFRRTFERDKDLLRSLGVPLELHHTDIWEVELGYVVPTERYAIDDPGLTDEERSALLVAAQAVRFGGQPTELSAIFKLGGAAQPAHAGTVLADLGHDLDTLGSLYGAVTDRSEVSFVYKGTARRVHPYGLIHRRGHWYLAAPEVSMPEPVKAFRVDRMSDVVVDEGTAMFFRPDSFDSSRSISTDAPDGRPRGTARVRFDPDIAQVAMRQMIGARRVEEDEHGVLIEVPMSTERSLIGWVLSFDDKAVIEHPLEAREAFTTFVRGGHDL